MISTYKLINEVTNRGTTISEIELLKLIRICDSMKYKVLANKLKFKYEHLEHPKKYSKELLK